MNTTPADNGTYTVAARARDAAGNVTTSRDGDRHRRQWDTTAPTVSLTAPANAATVSGTVTLTATAADNVGVAGVQFLVNNAPFSAEVTEAPYSVTWDTTTARQRHLHAGRASPRRRRHHHHLRRR